MTGGGLRRLAAAVLGVTLDKALEVRCSDWEAEALSAAQVMTSSCRLIAYGCRLYCTRLQALPHTAAGSIAYGCRCATPRRMHAWGSSCCWRCTPAAYHPCLLTRGCSGNSPPRRRAAPASPRRRRGRRARRRRVETARSAVAAHPAVRPLPSPRRGSCLVLAARPLCTTGG